MTVDSSRSTNLRFLQPERQVPLVLIGPTTIQPPRPNRPDSFRQQLRQTSPIHPKSPTKATPKFTVSALIIAPLRPRQQKSCKTYSAHLHANHHHRMHHDAPTPPEPFEYHTPPPAQHPQSSTDLSTPSIIRLISATIRLVSQTRRPIFLGHRSLLREPTSRLRDHPPHLPRSSDSSPRRPGPSPQTLTPKPGIIPQLRRARCRRRRITKDGSHGDPSTIPRYR